ncbi:MAG: TonB-dependent receptor [Acidobacteriia bacterium]|nr:TonB-dependent receptor [Terriglobia bacterium]
MPFHRAVTLRFFLCLIVALVSQLAIPALAQNPRGALRGEVQDGSGGRVSSAKIVVRAKGSDLMRDALTNARGEFRIEGLLPGAYHVAVNAKGFADADADVDVVVSTVRDLSVTLKPQAVTQTISVQGVASSITAEPIDTASAVHQGAVTANDLDTIPLAHRSFANIAYLVPGTEPVEPSDPTKARITAVSFGGSSGLNVDLSVDGADNSDDYIGGFLQNFSPDAIQEFAVRTSQEDADTGRTVGGSVVITTKHGTNTWHGSGAFYGRAASLNARYPIDNPPPAPKQPFSRQNYIGTLGGPIKQDKLWFFSSLEYVHENASVAYSPDSLSEFNALASLASQGLIMGFNLEGQPRGVSSIAAPNNVRVPFRDALGMLRFDWSQSLKSQWFARAAIDNYTTNNDLVQQATLPSTGATSGSNYLNLVVSNTYAFSPTWLGSFTFGASYLHHTESRNSNLGFALAFPFSSTFQTISGFETFGDNQFATPITAFPVLRNQEKYQFRYDVSHASGRHAPKFGINFIHEPVLSGALSGTEEALIQYPNNPSFYATNPSQFYFDPTCLSPVPDPNIACTATPAGDGTFSQNLQRLGLYAQDSWRVTSHLTVNYGLRYDTTFGLFTGSGRNQLQNPAYLTLKALQIPLINSAPHDYRSQFGPRLGIVYSPGRSENTVIRAGIGIYYNDLAQNGWVGAFQAVNAAPGPCTDPTNPGVDNSGCIPGANFGGQGAIIDPHYKTPYALHASAGIQHALNEHWTLSADWTHENGVHAYRAYPFAGGASLFTPLPLPDGTEQADFVPNVDVYKTDNRSRYDAMTIRLQGNMSRLNLTAHYTLATAKTWGCNVGELFDYVNGVCDPLNAFAPGDYGPSGEDVRHRFVLAGIVHAPLGFELSTLTQIESARPFTLGDGDNRAVINGVKTTLDQFRGTPFAQVDLRVARPIKVGDRWSVVPFVEFLNLFNRNNPSNNYVADVAALGVPADQIGGNITDLCGNADCTTLIPITSLNQLRKPAGALGDFFGPGTTVGIPFAAQLGVRVTF